MTHVYNVHKIFMMGKKTGKRSNHPCVILTGENRAEADAQWAVHPKRKDGVTYVIIDGGPAVNEDLYVAAQAAGKLRAVKEWAVGDECWIQLEPLNLITPEPYYKGKIYEIRECEAGPTACIWVLGDYQSWRSRLLVTLLERPPRGKAARHHEIEKRPRKKRGEPMTQRDSYAE